MTVEQLTFPALSRYDAAVLADRLATMEGSARLFAEGLAEMPVTVSVSGGYPRPSGWRRARDGSLSAHLWVDLESPLNRCTSDPPASVEDYCWAFRAGYLHALGLLLGSGAPRDSGATAVDSVARRENPRWRRIPARVRSELQDLQTRRYLEALFEILEGARTDAAMQLRFRGAAPYLEPRVRWAAALAESADAASALVALAFLGLRDRVDDRLLGRADAQAAAAYRQVEPVLRSIDVTGGPAAKARLAEILVYDLYPLLRTLGPSAQFQRQTEGQDTTCEPSERVMADFRCVGAAEFDSNRVHDAVGTCLVRLPHTDGGQVIVRTDFAEASDLLPDRVTEAAIRPMVETYGMQAVEAFAAESAGLRRALQLNYERRYKGRYRSGKRVGISNLRRYVVHDDLRLFQRLERPDALSYYFHLLVDVSYSMLEDKNVSKALAVAYAFTHLLTRLRVPVDVTLYSSGITELFDHRRHRLEPFFGGDFGFLVSGTLEIEALGFMKAKADRQPDRRKVCVVITDGTPVGVSLSALGATDLISYYRATLLPWLHAAGIDVIALGIGVEPAYHERAVMLAEGWDSLRIFLDLLESIVQEGERREREFWA